MNIEDVKQIPIADYLHSLGYSPVKQQGNGLWYKSPLREEHEPSFKVNTDRNLWYDFGAGKGGNIIALAKELYCSDSLPYLLNRIAEQTPHVRPVSFSFPQRRTEPSFQHLEVRDLTHPAFAELKKVRESKCGKPRLRGFRESPVNTVLSTQQLNKNSFRRNAYRWKRRLQEEKLADAWAASRLCRQLPR